MRLFCRSCDPVLIGLAGVLAVLLGLLGVLAVPLGLLGVLGILLGLAGVLGGGQGLLDETQDELPLGVLPAQPQALPVQVLLDALEVKWYL